MITEDYVSFETAKLLKEKGFDEATIGYYPIIGKAKETFHKGAAYRWNYFSDRGIAAPTLQMALKWIQEAHNIIIVADYEYECTDTSWYFKVYRLGENGKPESVPIKGVSYDKDNNPTEHIVGYRDYERSYKDYATREEAEDDGIRYVLENYI